MSSNYAGTNTLHGQITIPSDGDPAIAESVNTALRNLMDNSVYANTELANKIDIRGGTFTLSGGITIQGTPNWHQNVDTFFEDDVTHGATGLRDDHVLSVYDELRVRGTANLRYNVNVGSGPSQDLNVYSTSTFRENVSFLDDVTLGNTTDDAITVNGSLVVNEPATLNSDVSIADLSVANDTVLGSGSSSTATVNGQFAVTGSSTLGNASTDATTINGTLDVTGNVTLGNASSDDTVVSGSLSVVGDTVLGTNSANAVTIPATLTVQGPMTLNGALSTALTYTGFGRVPERVALINATTTVNVASGNVFVQTTNSTVVISMSDTGAGDGDIMEFYKTDNSAVLTVYLPDGSQLMTATAGSPAYAKAFRKGGAWYGMRIT